MARLSEDEITERRESSHWGRRDGSIERDFEFEHSEGAMGVVNRVADVAEEADHHPDIDLHDCNGVRLAFTNHSEGGLTADDLDMAAKVDGLV
jgi:4a-hydroxytetrahydrobiopterin dehydratase